MGSNIRTKVNSIQVFSGTVYYASHKGSQLKVLILYNISGNHFVGFPTYENNIAGSFYLGSINKYVIFEELIDISRNEISGPVYAKGKTLRITNRESKTVNKNTKDMLINQIDSNTDHRIQDDLECLKWDSKKIQLNKSSYPIVKYNNNQIVWMDFGYNVGSELRKLRPAILWKASGDKKTWNVIPLSTKCSQDAYYFHYDMTSLIDCSAKIESMTCFSSMRIIGTYYEKGKQAYISKNDEDMIKAIIKAYYTHDFTELHALDPRTVTNEV